MIQNGIKLQVLVMSSPMPSLKQIVLQVSRHCNCISNKITLAEFSPLNITCATKQQTSKQTNKQTDRQTNRQTNKQTNRQTDRQTNKQTKTSMDLN